MREGEREPGAPCRWGLDREIARCLWGEPAGGVEVRERLLTVPETAVGAKLHHGRRAALLEDHLDPPPVAGKFDGGDHRVRDQVAK